MPVEGQSLVLAGALISIAANSAVFAAIEPLQQWIRERSALARRLEQRDDPLAQLPMSTDEALLTGQVVLVGYGRVGRRIGEALARAEDPVRRGGTEPRDRRRSAQAGHPGGQR